MKNYFTQSAQISQLIDMHYSGVSSTLARVLADTMYLRGLTTSKRPSVTTEYEDRKLVKICLHHVRKEINNGRSKFARSVWKHVDWYHGRSLKHLAHWFSKRQISLKHRQTTLNRAHGSKKSRIRAGSVILWIEGRIWSHDIIILPVLGISRTFLDWNVVLNYENYPLCCLKAIVYEWHLKGSARNRRSWQ